MNTIRWMRAILSSIFILIGLIFGTYFYIKEHSLVAVEPQGCIVRISPKNNITILPFVDLQYPQ
ncbi:hypothetical protein APA_2686 [Pseudanabaena sp. lw0831]|uniref:hypothetical protein n=1 Tax=Pseudanabaena sp. lw0831 TaxID=1357935 RepID=UPI0019158820|nr:hypothetical protein [Pseudanabaena sp. lw0831]GBO51815.1 hypothetical protein APA_2686 [Pseudanabaena sp. lw0831]